MKTLGRHLIAEFYGCSVRNISGVHYVKEAMEAAALQANATIVQSSFHQFNPYGVSGVVVIAESHLTIHTWPEHGYASVDVYTCGDDVDPWVALKYLEKTFQSDNIEVIELPRGKMEKVLGYSSSGTEYSQSEEILCHF
jgi:S-adenosylmethionine decarboxylase